MKRVYYSWVALLLVGGLFVAPAVHAQIEEQPEEQLQVEPAEVELGVGETQQLSASVTGANGESMPDTTVVFFSRDRKAVSVTRDGLVKANEPGAYSLVALRPGRDGKSRLMAEVPVTVPYPPIERISFEEAPSKVYAGTRMPLNVTVVDAAGNERDNIEVSLSSSDDMTATVDAFGQVKGMKVGTATIVAEAEGVQASTRVEVVANPVARIELNGGQVEARTGDVLQFEAVAYDNNDQPVEDAPVTFAVNAQPADNLAPGATGQITEEGRFVAEDPGTYTIVATSGDVSAQEPVEIVPRDVETELEIVGHGQVSDVHTSDLWVWEAVDGRDYAVTGTWGANGEAYFWDVTDPANMTIVDTVTVDARTVNDVKVSEDGRVAVISREGASDRKNGIVILDVTDPNDVKIHSEYNENLTGGVHNVFIYDNHVYALSNARRYDIINIEDPANPRTVGSFELDTPGHSIHDVWVEDGIAYSSNWDDGVVLVDVGNGIAGGSPSNPVKIGSYAYPSGWNHAAFPYRDEETGKFYVIAGDEAFPNGLNVDDRPTIPAGWLHFIDFTDMDNPKEVARYQVPNAGTHNYWVQGDTLYVAYYNAGLRVVDISGDLMGNLYEQGREMAHFVPYDPEGRVPNAPMTWGPQPYKGHIFISDWNSGLWSIKMKQPPKPELTP